MTDPRGLELIDRLMCGEEAVLLGPGAGRLVEQRARLRGVAVRGPRGSRYGDRCRGRGGLRRGGRRHQPGQAGRQPGGQHRQATREAGECSTRVRLLHGCPHGPVPGASEITSDTHVTRTTGLSGNLLP